MAQFDPNLEIEFPPGSGTKIDAAKGDITSVTVLEQRPTTGGPPNHVINPERPFTVRVQWELRGVRSARRTPLMATCRRLRVVRHGEAVRAVATDDHQAHLARRQHRPDAVEQASEARRRPVAQLQHHRRSGRAASSAAGRDVSAPASGPAQWWRHASASWASTAAGGRTLVRSQTACCQRPPPSSRAAGDSAA